MLHLEGRVAVVTGGSSGIGLACMNVLKTEGAQPVSWDLSGRDLTGHQATHCDVSDKTSVDAAMQWTLSSIGIPSLLVASAGTPSAGLITDMDVEEWDRVFAVNMRGVMLAVRVVAREIIRANIDGSFVLVSSVNGHVADPGVSSYGASKAAVFHFARIAAREFGPHRIRVNAVGPGPTETPMLKPLLENARFRQEVVQRTALREVGTPERIAEAIVGLMKLDWITGQAIMADGGSSLNTGRGDWQARTL
jgi:NAD(P)-dependent dehydrogenase (short-subunit alcohol dehydrogenase family)